MKGLILKDIINLKAQLKLYVVFFILWFVIAMINDAADFLGGVMLMYVVMFLISSVAYDDKNNWNRLALTMPVSRRDLVLSKYLFMLIGMLAICFVTLAGCTMINGRLGESFRIVLLTCPVGILFSAVLIPVFLQFGVEKGRFLFVGFALLFALAAFVMEKFSVGAYLFDGKTVSFFLPDLFHIILLFWAAAAVCTGLSMMLSVRIYEKKDF